MGGDTSESHVDPSKYQLALLSTTILKGASSILVSLSSNVYFTSLLKHCTTILLYAKNITSTCNKAPHGSTTEDVLVEPPCSLSDMTACSSSIKTLGSRWALSASPTTTSEEFMPN